MKFSVLTLFPESLSGFFDTSIIGRARKSGKIEIDLIQIRDFSTDRHRKTDDAPFGGGAGMVMCVQPLRDALFHVLGMETPKRRDDSKTRVVLTSPRGGLLNQAKCESLSRYEHLILICGHYEGIDQRFIDRYVDEEISVGDYVLTGGEPAAAIIVDSVARLKDNVLTGESLDFESHSAGLLEYPHYTRPEEFDGDRVPAVLLSGHHQNIEKWRLEQAEAITRERRPDLYREYLRRKSLQ